MCFGAVFFLLLFSPTGLRLVKSCLLHFSFQNSGRNKTSSIGQGCTLVHQQWSSPPATPEQKQCQAAGCLESLFPSACHSARAQKYPPLWGSSSSSSYWGNISKAIVREKARFIIKRVNSNNGGSSSNRGGLRSRCSALKSFQCCLPQFSHEWLLGS